MRPAHSRASRTSAQLARGGAGAARAGVDGTAGEPAGGVGGYLGDFVTDRPEVHQVFRVGILGARGLRHPVAGRRSGRLRIVKLLLDTHVWLWWNTEPERLAATAVRQIVADELCMDIQAVRVVHGDTDVVPYGIGSFASRATVMAGNAAHSAATAVKQRLREIASDLLETEREDLVFNRGTVSVRGVPDQVVLYGQLVAETAPGRALSRGGKVGVSDGSPLPQNGQKDGRLSVKSQTALQWGQVSCMVGI